MLRRAATGSHDIVRAHFLVYKWDGRHYGELLLLLGHLKLVFKTSDLSLLICNLSRLFAPLALVLEKRIHALFEDSILVFKTSFLFLSRL